MTAWRATMPGFGVRQTSRSVLFGTIGTIGTHKITQQGQHKIGKKEYSMTAQGPSWRPCNNRPWWDATTAPCDGTNPSRGGRISKEGKIMPDYNALKAHLRGDLIQPGDGNYDEARKLYNAMIDKKPAAIARCVDVADVMACVNYARSNGILLAVRGGGHNGPGLGSCNGGLVIDLSRMRGVRVDPGAKTAQVAGGCVWGDVDHATHPFTTTFQSPSHR